MLIHRPTVHIGIDGGAAKRASKSATHSQGFPAVLCQAVRTTGSMLDPVAYSHDAYTATYTNFHSIYTAYVSRGAALIYATAWIVQQRTGVYVCIYFIGSNGHLALASPCTLGYFAYYGGSSDMQ